ncbi:MAG: serine/threonine-protein kinase [Chloroflexota bacterium]
MSNQHPETIGPYQILETIGKGGTSFVYRAVDTRQEQTVALKVLPTQHADDPKYLRRFVREGQNAARLKHPNVVRIYDAGEYDRYHTIAMELLHGGTLTECLSEQGVLLPLEVSIQLIKELAAGLDYAHQQGFIHRDIKPSNILLTGSLAEPKTKALISDFGIARRSAGEMTALTQNGYTTGTPAFMSPEQAQGLEDIDSRSDIYSLGVVAYMLFTGKMPHKADTQLALLHQVVYEPPIAPDLQRYDLPVGIVYALNKVLAKEPSERFETASEFAALLTKGVKWIPSTKEMLAVLPSAPSYAIQPATEQNKTKRLSEQKGTRNYFVPALAATFLIAISFVLFLAWPVELPIPKWLTMDRATSVSNAPVVLRPFYNPNGYYQINTPSNWPQRLDDDRAIFESVEFIGRVFVEPIVLEENEPDSILFKGYLDSAQLPFQNLIPVDAIMASSAESSVSSSAPDRLQSYYAGDWLGQDVILELEWVPIPNSNRGYILGSVVETQYQDTFSHLLDMITESFTLMDITGQAITSDERLITGELPIPNSPPLQASLKEDSSLPDMAATAIPTGTVASKDVSTSGDNPLPIQTQTADVIFALVEERLTAIAEEVLASEQSTAQGASPTSFNDSLTELTPTGVVTPTTTPQLTSTPESIQVESTSQSDP